MVAIHKANSIGICKITGGKVVYKDDDKIPETTKTSYQEVLEGEFLINPLNLNYDLISLRIGLSEINVVVSSGYIVLKNIIDIDKTYFKYLLHRYDVAYMKLLGSGVRQTINFNHIANSILAFPPLQEQTAIANFLDDKTVKIDHVIAQKEKMIALLKERKQIIIQDLVTGKKVWNDALNSWTEPDKVKDSGVEWIGEIPAHWVVRRFKLLCNISTGSKNTEDKKENGEFPFFVRSQNVERIDTYTFEGEAILTAGDGAGVGKVFHYVNERFDFHQRVYKFSNFKSINGKYLFFYLQSNFYNVALNGEAKSTVDSLRLRLIQDFLVSFPSLKEQTSIVNYIESQSAKIDKAIALQEQQIEKLKELKSTLIDSAVTGKIKV